MTLPTFLVIGAPKCATTSLYSYFKQHPDVFMCTPKEPNFFVADDPGLISSWPDWLALAPDSYEALFEEGAAHRARGEASTSYLVSPYAPEAVRRLIPNARLLVVLRDPVARAYSAWAHLRQRDREPIDDFLGAVAAEPERTAAGGFPNLTRYVEAGLYHRQLARWMEIFVEEQIQIHFTEDLNRDPVGVMRSCFAHVGVSPDFDPDVSIRSNRSGIPRSRRAVGLLDGFGATHAGRLARAVVPPGLRLRARDRLQSANLRPVPPLETQVYEQLAGRFADDLRALRELLGRELHDWPTVKFIDS